MFRIYKPDFVKTWNLFTFEHVIHIYIYSCSSLHHYCTSSI